LAGTKVTIFSNGPIRVEGDFSIVDQDGKEFGLGDAPPSRFAAAATRETRPSATEPISGNPSPRQLRHAICLQKPKKTGFEGP